MFEIDGLEYYELRIETRGGSFLHTGPANLIRPKWSVAQPERNRRVVFIKMGETVSQKALLWREYQGLRHACPHPRLSTFISRFLVGKFVTRSASRLLDYLICIGPKIIRRPKLDEMSLNEKPSYLIVEYLGHNPGSLVSWSGESLNDRVLKGVGRFSYEDWAYLANSLVHILEVLHRRGVYHCDLTPDHIWIKEDPLRLRLVDFGLSYVTRQGLEYLAGGTDLYTAPEVYTSQDRTTPFKSPSPTDLRLLDYFGLGACLYFAATGLHPPTESLLWSRLNQNPIDPKEIRRFQKWFEGQIEPIAERNGLGRLSREALLAGLSFDPDDKRPRFPEYILNAIGSIIPR